MKIMPTTIFSNFFTIILPFFSMLPILTFLTAKVDGYDGMGFQLNDRWEQQQKERRPIQWRLRKWRPLDINGKPFRFLQRRIRSIGGIIPQSIQQQTTDEWAPLFGSSSSATAYLKKLGQEDDEPLVISRYNRDCFFTPMNCFVGRAGQQATNIVGSASNSKRQILFIKRRHRNGRKWHQKAKKSSSAAYL